MPIYCNQTIATCYKEACQKPGQVVTDFVAYLDKLEDKLSLYDNKACLRHLKTKLWPGITNKLIAWPNPLKTCQGAIDLAIWLDRLNPLASQRQSSHADWTPLCVCAGVNADTAAIFIGRHKAM